MKTAYILLTIVLFVALAACGARRDPGKVVENMYNALQEGDTDAYLDTLLPANRSTPDLTGVLSTVLGGVGVTFGGVGFDLGGLLSPSFANMSYTTVVNDGRHALVQAKGKIRIMMMEFSFCDTHDVVREGGSWYVDNYHPARQARVQQLTARNQQQLLEQNPGMSPNVDPLEDIAQAFTLMGPAMEVMLNLCE